MITAGMDDIIRPLSVKALPGYKVQVSYPGGIEGVIDLSADVGHGVFAPLADESYFSTVHLGEFGQIAWSDDIEICSDSAYQEILRRTPVDVSHA
jgi:hypothetical protein